MTSQNQTLSEFDRVNAACHRLSMHSVAESLPDLLQQAASCNLTHAAVLHNCLRHKSKATPSQPNADAYVLQLSRS